MDHEGPARRDPLERRLRAEGTFGEWLDLEVGQGLADELRHGYLAFVCLRLTKTEHPLAGLKRTSLVAQ